MNLKTDFIFQKVKNYWDKNKTYQLIIRHLATLKENFHLHLKSWYPEYLMVLSVILFFAILIYGTPVIQNNIFTFSKSSGNSKITILSENKIEKAKIKLKKEINQLEKTKNYLTTNASYLVINSTENNFKLYKNRKLIKKGICSTGSYILLEKGNNEKWLFRTPGGMHTIQGKTTSPIWKKPDWAFIEEGLPVPTKDHPSRFEAGVLGDYALSLGKGYMLHGTLYKRMLGMPVTHGCVRFNDEDLEFIYNNLSIGSKVYIY